MNGTSSSVCVAMVHDRPRNVRFPARDSPAAIAKQLRHTPAGGNRQFSFPTIDSIRPVIRRSYVLLCGEPTILCSFVRSTSRYSRFVVDLARNRCSRPFASTAKRRTTTHRFCPRPTLLAAYHAPTHIRKPWRYLAPGTILLRKTYYGC